MSTVASEISKFDKLAADIKMYAAPCLSLVVSDQQSQIQAQEAGKSIKDFQKRIEEKRKELKAPLLERQREIDDYAKKLQEPLLRSESHIKTQLMAWERELQKIREEEFRKAEAERLRKEKEALAAAKAKEEEAAISDLFGVADPHDSKTAAAMAEVEKERVETQIAKEHRTAVKEIDSMKVSGKRQVWTFKIVDQKLVPREFFVLDEKLVREQVRMGVREIPGVEIFQETQIAFR